MGAKGIEGEEEEEEEECKVLLISYLSLFS
jgi:hypothetical protein